MGDRDGDRGRSVSSPPPPLAINWQSTGHTDGNQRHRVAIKGHTDGNQRHRVAIKGHTDGNQRHRVAIKGHINSPSTSESVPFTLIVENVGWFQVAMEQRRLACMQVRAARDDVEQRRE